MMCAHKFSTRSVFIALHYTTLTHMHTHTRTCAHTSVHKRRQVWQLCVLANIRLALKSLSSRINLLSVNGTDKQAKDHGDITYTATIIVRGHASVCVCVCLCVRVCAGHSSCVSVYASVNVCPCVRIVHVCVHTAMWNRESARQIICEKSEGKISNTHIVTPTFRSLLIDCGYSAEPWQGHLLLLKSAQQEPTITHTCTCTRTHTHT